jgi:hypothetical protein
MKGKYLTLLLLILMYGCSDSKKEISNCNYGDDLKRYDSSPDFDTIQGVYRLDSFSIEKLRKEGYAISDHSLYLWGSYKDQGLESGLFLFKNIPDMCFDYKGKSGGKIFDFFGSYRLSHTPPHKDYYTDYDISIDYIHQKYVKAGGRGLDIKSRNNKPVIIFRIGKPDDCNYIIYEKVGDTDEALESKFKIEYDSLLAENQKWLDSNSTRLSGETQSMVDSMRKDPRKFYNRDSVSK